MSTHSVFPFDLKFYLFLIPIAFVLDSKFGPDGDIDAFTRDLYLEAFFLLDGICQTA